MNAQSLVLVVAGLLPSAPPPPAEQFDRRSRDEPEIAVDAGGRVGTCDVLRFSANGQLLFAAGDDKVVRVWPHSETGLETDRAKVQTLRWRAWREQRGGIKALAVSPDAKRVAAGGYGLKPSSVALLDRATGETLALSWPEVRKGETAFGTVHAIAFAEDGRIGFGTSEGSLWVWNPARLGAPDENGRTAAPPVRVGRHDLPKLASGRAELNPSRLIYFPNKDKLVSVSQGGQVYECSLVSGIADTPERAPPGRALFYTFDGLPDDSVEPVFRAELVAYGKWLLVAPGGPRVLLRSADGKTTIPLALKANQFPRSVAWHPKTRQLAVGVGTVLGAGADPRFYSEGNDQIWIYDDPITNPNAQPTRLDHTGRADALAFHPTEPRLAVAGGDADEVTLLNLADPRKPISVVLGAGRRPWAVNISENGKTVGVRVERDPDSLSPNARGLGAWTRFDLSRLKPTLDEGQTWVNPLTSADDWKIVPDSDRSQVWFAERNGVKLRLALDRFRDQAPTCFTFLRAQGGKPTRVIVGHTDGCTLFELVPARALKDGSIAGTKVFTGHAGAVTSVVASKDQTWFLTGAADHTVAAWSLADRKYEAGLGARFEDQEGKLTVTGVDPASPAWEAGLRVGDELDQLVVGRIRVYDRSPGEKEVGTVSDALAALKAPRPRIELYFGIAASAKTPRHETLTTVRQRPLWKWFPAFDAQNRMNDWVIWTWHGSYYHTKTANGDRLVGWHVNHPDVGGRPEFYQLQQFEKRFHRPDVLEKLIETGSAGEALVLARGEAPVLEPFSTFEPAPVRVAVKELEVPPLGLPLTISVRTRGTNPDLLPERVELWLNDHLLESWPAAGQVLDPKKHFNETRTIPADRFRTGANQITVLTFNALGGRGEAAQLVQNPRSASEANLIALLAGVNDYSNVRKNPAGARNFGDLTSARDDASALGTELEKFAGPKLLFKDARIDLHHDPLRAKFVSALGAIEKQARPDDTLIVFFAGHGDLLMPKDGPLPNAGRGLLADEGTFLFCCPDYTPAKPGATALSADELFTALAKINCRKVVLLDACHSGRAAAANVLRRCVPNGQGPIIIAACDQGEQSFEHPKYAHGLFTFAVLDALDKDKSYRKADADSDGALSAEELFDFVSGKVPDLLKRAGIKEPQHPVCFPRQLPKSALLKR